MDIWTIVKLFCYYVQVHLWHLQFCISQVIENKLEDQIYLINLELNLVTKKILLTDESSQRALKIRQNTEKLDFGCVYASYDSTGYGVSSPEYKISNF